MTITDVQDLVRTHYVFPEVAERIAEAVAGVRLDGTGPEADAAALTAALQSVNGDLHLRVRHYPDGVPPDQDEDEVAAWFAWMADERGPRIAGARRLDGNVGLVVLGPIILAPTYVGPAAAAAFTLLAG